MAPVNFDKHIKDKLEERRLKPSVNAWDKLSERLDANEKKKHVNLYWWYGVAASIVGVLFVVSQLVDNKQEIIAPQVVETPKGNKPEALEQKSLYSSGQKQTQEKIVTTQKSGIKIKDESPVKSVGPILNKVPVIVSENIEVSKTSETITPTKELKEALTFEEQKVQQVVAQVKALKEQKNKVTDTEVEALLQQAQREIALKKLYNESATIVDANKLLQEVETDLDKSFRTKVFEALKASYGTVKTAVANRNN
ncbi:hypothetical protein BWZ22_04460 [Seonamhaeicola sp. S2-3]|uniref:hypothetical protein n=1 Tax=Seonamhaeicola sp. S2-3 TaxID=1936081 RepID=UPI000972E7BE|nr:hypothetical protein [Seonamhaeicola sp. S2-3]APY10538.1 hypothetical protein BWZ22_04460 [Seonamhaeicola sp. S2-3]